MDTNDLPVDFVFTPTDIAQIKKGIHLWGKPEQLMEQYGEQMLRKQFDCWKKFVSFDWTPDWSYEYDHDKGCRYWIQLAIEYATPTTRKQLEALIAPYDALFKQKMVVQKIEATSSSFPDPFKKHPYFWETHTILPIEESQK